MAQNSRKILIFSTAYLPHIGGAELALKEVTDRVKGFSFDLITSRLSFESSPLERMGNVNVYRVGNPLLLKKLVLPKLFFPLSGLFKARQLIKQGNGYSMIFALQASQGGGAAWLYKTFIDGKIPFILNIQEGKDLEAQGRVINFLRRQIIKKADLVVVISKFLEAYILEGGVDKNKVKLIPNGVDFKVFSKEFNYGELSELSDSLGIKPDEKVIISASRLTHKNGIDDLINGFATLVSIDTGHRYKLLLLGEGEKKEALSLLVRQLKIEDRVIFAGRIDNQILPKYLKIAHVFVRPSRSEGLGTAFLEAMAADLPVIGTSVGGIKDFLFDPAEFGDQATGLVCKTGNPDSLAQCLLKLFQDDSLRKKLIANGQKLVRAKYDWDQISLEYGKIFSKLAIN